MKKTDIIKFFNDQAPHWDADMIRSDEIIDRILKGAGVGPGDRVLDVATGTGVLIPDYLSRNAASVAAVDISPEMVKICGEKFAGDSRVTVICADVEELQPDTEFDRIMIYNAFPHFIDQEGLIRRLSGWLSDGGTLTVAHGMSREQLDRHHSGSAAAVSTGLMPVEELTGIFEKYLKVSVAISDDSMYQVTGKK